MFRFSKGLSLQAHFLFDLPICFHIFSSLFHGSNERSTASTGAGVPSLDRRPPALCHGQRLRGRDHWGPSGDLGRAGGGSKHRKLTIIWPNFLISYDCQYIGYEIGVNCLFDKKHEKSPFVLKLGSDTVSGFFEASKTPVATVQLWNLGLYQPSSNSPWVWVCRTFTLFNLQQLDLQETKSRSVHSLSSFSFLKLS